MELLRTRKISKVGSSSTLANFFARGEVSMGHISMYESFRPTVRRDDSSNFMIVLKHLEQMIVSL